MKRFLLFTLSLFFMFSGHAQGPEFEAAYHFSSTGFEGAQGVVTDHANNVFISGSFTHTLDFDPGLGIYELTTVPFGTEELFIQKLSSSGELLWVHHFNLGDGVLSVRGGPMLTDAWGNVYISGSFAGTVDFDPGPNVFSMTSFGSTHRDIFILKLDTFGNFLWAKQLGGPDPEHPASIDLDPSGNIITTGLFKATLDFDPGVGTFMLTAEAAGDLFIQKLDSLGNFIWAKQLGSNADQTVSMAGTDQDGNIILTGTFEGSMDFDPGPNTFTLHSLNNNQDLFSLKLHSNGDFSWATQITSSLYSRGFYSNEIEQRVTVTGEVYVAGSFIDEVDFDPGPDTLLLRNTGARNYRNLFVQKLSANGELLWVKQVGSPSGQNTWLNFNEMILDDDESIYLQGAVEGIVDFDPGLGVDSLIIQDPNVYILKLNPHGDYVWARTLELDHSFFVQGISVDRLGGLYLGGFFQSPFDVDPGPNDSTLTPHPTQGISDMFLIKWSQDICANLSAVVSRADEVTCSNIALLAGHGSGGLAPYTYFWDSNPSSTDSIAIVNASGIYNFTVVDDRACSQTSQVLVPGRTSLQSRELKVNVTSGVYRPGRATTITVDAYNDGCAASDAEVSLILDPFLILSSSIPLPDTVIGNKLIWKVKDLIDSTGHFIARIEVGVSTEANIGDQICLGATISLKGGGNNTKFNNRNYCRDVINSYDPNDKRVYPEGACEEGFIANEEILTYTLRFQNTGNASAIDVYLLDSLDVNLDLNTVRVVGQSHKPMITEVLEDQVLKFRFDNIYLPDSTTDEPNSHGYVIYEVSPLPNLPIGTEIKNNAGIYFDFNEPVITNTVLNTITDVVPAQDTAFVQASGCNSYALNGRTYTASGEYVQRISRSNGCDSTLVLNLSLNPLDTTITQIGTTLTANEGGAHGLNVDYQWVDCGMGNAPINGATSQNFSPTSNGNYAAIISRGDCSEMSACVNVSTVGIDTDFQSEISYYPNPSSGIVHMNLGAYYEKSEIEVINTMGQVLERKGFDFSDEITFQLPELMGFYFVKVKAEGKTAILKILKK